MKIEETATPLPDNTDASSTIAPASDASVAPSEILDEIKTADTENQIPLPDNVSEIGARIGAMSTDEATNRSTTKWIKQKPNFFSRTKHWIDPKTEH